MAMKSCAKRLRELASRRRRFGSRRLGLLLERQGIKLNRKKPYRLYKEERLTAAALAVVDHAVAAPSANAAEG
jgi:hypothetical protein